MALACSAGSEAAHAGRLDAHPTLADSTAAREAVQQYLAALTHGDYGGAARLHAGSWRDVAAHVLESAPDTLSFAGFLAQTCRSGLYVCHLSLRRVVQATFVAPDTLKLLIEYADSTGSAYQWGPCCGSSGPPETQDLFVAVARDSGYAVLNLPLYIP